MMNLLNRCLDARRALHAAGGEDWKTVPDQLLHSKVEPFRCLTQPCQISDLLVILIRNGTPDRLAMPHLRTWWVSELPRCAVGAATLMTELDFAALLAICERGISFLVATVASTEVALGLALKYVSLSIHGPWLDQLRRTIRYGQALPPCKVLVAPLKSARHATVKQTRRLFTRQLSMPIGRAKP